MRTFGIHRHRRSRCGAYVVLSSVLHVLGLSAWVASFSSYLFLVPAVYLAQRYITFESRASVRLTSSRGRKAYCSPPFFWAMALMRGRTYDSRSKHQEGLQNFFQL